VTNHVHLLVTPLHEDNLPRTLQSLGRRYVRHVNGAYRQSGTLWEGRYRAAPIDSEAYFLACCRTIELDPVRAGMVDHPRAYRWSSCRAHADGAAAARLSEHAIYRALGRGGEARRKAYRALFRFTLDGEFVEALGAATNGGWALGDARFAQGIVTGRPRPQCGLGARPGARSGPD
jgi:putative transposase